MGVALWVLKEVIDDFMALALAVYHGQQNDTKCIKDTQSYSGFYDDLIINESMDSDSSGCEDHCVSKFSRRCSALEV